VCLLVRLQWMTAGRGIIHSEMPESSGDALPPGFPLWATLPAKDKMGKPRYPVGGGGLCQVRRQLVQSPWLLW